MFDTTLNIEVHLSRFCKIFGEGAEEISEVIRYAEQIQNGQTDIMTAGLWLSRNIDKQNIYRLYDKALEKASTAFARNNIRLMRMAFRYTDLETSLQEAPCDDTDFQSIISYTEPTGELYTMTEFDSFWRNDPGFGISIPGTGYYNKEFKKDIWYTFD